jgi:hypothetical protein
MTREQWPRVLSLAPQDVVFLCFMTAGLQLVRRSAVASQLYEQLTPSLLGVDKVDQWPGTISYDLLDRLIFPFDQIRTVLGETPEALGWEAGDGLYDLHILRSDGTLWFAVQGCDGSWWMHLKQVELADRGILDGLGVVRPAGPDDRVDKVWISEEFTP